MLKNFRRTETCGVWKSGRNENVAQPNFVCATSHDLFPLFLKFSALNPDKSSRLQFLIFALIFEFYLKYDQRQWHSGAQALVSTIRS
jgi:hypothetical protein